MFHLFKKKKKENILNWDKISLSDWLYIKTVHESPDFFDDLIEYFFKVEVKNLTVMELLEYQKKLDFLGTKIPENKITNKYTLNNTTYSVSLQPQNFTVAQFQDYTEFIKRKSNNEVELLTVLLIPENHTYNDGYDLEKVKEDILTLNISDFLAITNFYVNSFNLFVTLSLDYLKKELMKMEMDEEKKEEIMRKMEVLVDYQFSVSSII